MADNLPPDNAAPDASSADKRWIVTPQTAHFTEPFALTLGGVLPTHQIVYETYGTLNADRSNAVLVCHALSGDHHAAGYHEGAQRPGWWNHCIGPGKPIDTRRFFVVCPNNLGGCGGSTGPSSINPATDKIYGADFPGVTVKDWVRSQALLAAHLGIDRWAAVAGGSLGGMQALQWAIDRPQQVAHAITIACTSRLSPQNIAFNKIARQAIRSDPNYAAGRYLEQGLVPADGLALARMIGHVTYQSDESMRKKFGRELSSGDLSQGDEVQFQVESYLDHQGESFSRQFDANTYLLMTRALDYFDPAADHGDDLVAALRQAQSGFLVISFTTDWRFPSMQSRKLMRALIRAGRNASWVDIEAQQGHDAFLLANADYLHLLGTYMNRIADARV